MPSKKYNGNSPLQGARLGSFADAELEIAKRSPRQALTTGVLQTPSGAIHTPKRRRRSRAGTSSHPWKVSLKEITDDDEVIFTVLAHTFADFRGGTLSPTPRGNLFGSSTLPIPLSDLTTTGAYVFLGAVDLNTDEELPADWRWDSQPAIATPTNYETEEPPSSPIRQYGANPKYPIASVVPNISSANGFSIVQSTYTSLGLFQGCINGVASDILATV